MIDLTVQVAAPGQHLAEAATIWAEATAARDNDPDPAPLDQALPLIEQVIGSSPRALLVVAVDNGTRVHGFAAIEPSDESTGEFTAHIRYLGVRPSSWGLGVGRLLMRDLPGLLAAAGFTEGELGVYLDNPRAVTLYESFGWLRDGEPAPHPRSGRLEQRYRLEL
ncbi:GNAT family N-acetyltransferase [Actinoplanes philippinensis]|uniref:GNAT family N-acetyltransferase n=1 Tax=Actinoplanes philippinensis TaxID=35752 RepID=UPI00340C7DCB